MSRNVSKLKCWLQHLHFQMYIQQEHYTFKEFKDMNWIECSEEDEHVCDDEVEFYIEKWGRSFLFWTVLFRALFRLSLIEWTTQKKLYILHLKKFKSLYLALSNVIYLAYTINLNWSFPIRYVKQLHIVLRQFKGSLLRNTKFFISNGIWGEHFLSRYVLQFI